MKRFLIILFLFLTTALLANAEQLLDSAAKYYAKGDYIKAIENYRKLVEQGYEASELYYNLGNSYFKINRIPEALLYYEKAKKLAPSDDDILYNLGIANTRIVDKIEPIPELLLTEWWKHLINFNSSDEWAKWTIIFLISFLVLLSGFFFVNKIVIKKFCFYFCIVLFVFAVFSFIFAKKQTDYMKSKDYAVLFAPSVTVKSSPDESGTDLFVIHKGLKVQITDELGDWYEIKLGNGAKGWLKKENVEVI